MRNLVAWWPKLRLGKIKFAPLRRGAAARLVTPNHVRDRACRRLGARMRGLICGGMRGAHSDPAKCGAHASVGTADRDHLAVGVAVTGLVRRCDARILACGGYWRRGDGLLTRMGRGGFRAIHEQHENKGREGRAPDAWRSVHGNDDTSSVHQRIASMSVSLLLDASRRLSRRSRVSRPPALRRWCAVNGRGCLRHRGEAELRTRHPVPGVADAKPALTSHEREVAAEFQEERFEVLDLAQPRVARGRFVG